MLFRELLQRCRTLHRDGVNLLFNATDLAAQDPIFAMTFDNFSLHLACLDDLIHQWYGNPCEELQQEIQNRYFWALTEKLEMSIRGELLEKEKKEYE